MCVLIVPDKRHKKLGKSDCFVIMNEILILSNMGKMGCRNHMREVFLKLYLIKDIKK